MAVQRASSVTVSPSVRKSTWGWGLDTLLRTASVHHCRPVFPTVPGELPTGHAEPGFNFTTAICRLWRGWGLGISLAPKATPHMKNVAPTHPLPWQSHVKYRL